MSLSIREMRKKTGMTQKDFAGMYGIPLSTLRKWEQGEASPPDYVIRLLAGTLPALDTSLRTIRCNDGSEYYYNRDLRQISDVRGNTIAIQEDLEGVKEHNLRLYVRDLFTSFYALQEKFNNDCRYDRQEDILWI